MTGSRYTASVTTTSCAQEPTNPTHPQTENVAAVGHADLSSQSGADNSGENSPNEQTQPPAALVNWLMGEFQKELPTKASSLKTVTYRFASEVDRICRMSNRIQSSGDVEQWQKSLARHRLNKCLHYFNLGSRQGRVELHSTLSAIAYRYIAPRQAQLGFEGRYTLLEDFLQGFYIEVLKAFRR
ncbi:MAG: hypothetical protein AAFY20_24720, partial [Cyanobacteria bacterium J06639_14]